MDNFGKNVYMTDSEIGSYIEVRNKILKALRGVLCLPNKPVDAIKDLQEALDLINNRIDYIKKNND